MTVGSNSLVVVVDCQWCFLTICIVIDCLRISKSMVSIIVVVVISVVVVSVVVVVLNVNLNDEGCLTFSDDRWLK